METPTTSHQDTLKPQNSQKELIGGALHSQPFQEMRRGCTDEISYKRAISRSVFLLSFVDKAEDIHHAVDIVKRMQDTKADGINRTEESLQMDMAIALVEQQTGWKFAERPLDIADIILKKSIRTYFHGTNVHALKGIEEHGLTPQEGESDVDWSVIQRLQRITGRDQIVGLLNKSSQNVHLTTHSELAYGYAVGSPEWFDHLLTDLGPQQPGQWESPLRERDYDRARVFVETAIATWKAQNKLVGDDEQAILAFFERSWYTYAASKEAAILLIQDDKLPPRYNGTPYRSLAILCGVGIETESEEEIKSKLANHPDAIRRALGLMQRPGVDFPVAQTIPTDVIIPFTFPLFIK